MVLAFAPPAAEPALAPAAPAAPPALWGGIECTVNRVGDVWYDQLRRSGHDARPDDLDRIAALGLRTLRYPLLWERIAPEGPATADWRRADERLGRLRELGIRPILGLVHHGSGPRDTHLLDPRFGDKLAVFARAAAERYSWVEDWTPVNEPLTTARFAALYGHWYPHARDARSFIRALVNQCRGVKLAMRAIREVVPGARLIQTEDLGHTWATPPLAYQADYENERRWLTFDFLCGRAGRAHPLWAHLWWLGLEGDDLFHFVEEPCPPDVMGLNYYLTSERFLDHRLDHYPPHLHGGNARDVYADVEAVRVCGDGIAGLGPLLAEAWARYRLPLAVTEAHLGCTREDQLRWLTEIWQTARAARASGIDLRAVTVWSLFGAYDWHCLLTRCEDRYEPGVFDLRAPTPRPTALAALAARLAAGEDPDHPLLAAPGWWRRPERLLFPPWPPAPGEASDGTGDGNAVAGAFPAGHPAEATERAGGHAAAAGDEGTRAALAQPPRRTGTGGARPLLVAGADEPFGQAVVAACAARGIAHCPLAAEDAADPARLDAALSDGSPWAVVDARLRRDPDRLGNDPDGWVRRVAAEVEALAAPAAERGLPLVAVSSDLVFGPGDGPCRESDAPAPLHPLGVGHAALEARLRRLHPEALILRSGVPLGGGEPGGRLRRALVRLAAGQPVVAEDGPPRSFAALPDLAGATLDLLIDGERGPWHLAHPEATTWADLLRAVARRGGHDPALVAAAPTAPPGDGFVPSPPAGGRLASERGWIMPRLAEAVAAIG